MFDEYGPLPGAYDELYLPDGSPRSSTADLATLLRELGERGFRSRQAIADAAFREGGVTFSVYSDAQGSEKVFPFDLVPRPVSAEDWTHVEAGLAQRVKALDLFLADVYGEQRILAEGRIPAELVHASQGYLPQMKGVRPPGGVHVQIAGIDLIRAPSGELLVLEDNVRTPSGVSYVLENRAVMKRIYPRIFQRTTPRSVAEYPHRLRDALLSLSPVDPEDTRLVVLTPGPLNSAYFEHSYLARCMGCELVEGRDLFVQDGHVHVKTTRGPSRVDVVYRRIDDDFLDPTTFREDSVIGVPGLVEVYAAGRVTLANGIGNGVADDKAIYPHVPEMIRFYLSEEPILGQIETYQCSRPAELSHVLENLEQLVVKAVDASGGYGMLFGPLSTEAERSSFAERLRANPRGYIAQPVVELSTCPTWTPSGLAPRRVDLRPFVVSGRSRWVLPGGLTRVALREGSYVVNSSQGGGSKDTWVLPETNS